MKIFITFIVVLLPLACSGEELLLGKQKIQIQKLQGLSVNKTCVTEEKACLDLIKKKAIKTEVPGPMGTVGNPASKYCAAKDGSSVILEDKNHNQYDYCLFKEKYLVDSWELYRKEKK